MAVKVTNQKSILKIEQAIKWLNSKEGIIAMNEAMKRADKACKYYKKAREPDWSRIHEPMTI